MSNTDPNAKSNPASESTSPRTLSPTTSLRTKKSRNTLYRYFFGADGRATRKDVPGEEYDPDFSDMPGTPEIRAAAARRVAIRRALGGTSMLSTLSDEELEEMTDAARVMDFTPAPDADDDHRIIHAAGEPCDGFYVVLSGDVGVRWGGDGVGGWPTPSREPRRVPLGQSLCVRACVYNQPLRHDVLAMGGEFISISVFTYLRISVWANRLTSCFFAAECSLIRVDRDSFRRCFDADEATSSGTSAEVMQERREQAKCAMVVRLLRALPYTRDLMDEEIRECALMFKFR